MSFNTIIIDDQDARITYSGQWSLAGSEMDFRHTLFSSQNSGASASFTFNGTSMILMGNIDANGTCNATISLDGANYPFNPPPVNTSLHHEVLWSSPTLTDGLHSFIYTVESCSNSTGSLWFDYILYNSTNDAASDGVTYFIDDRDPMLQYSGSWEQAGGDGDFMHTRQGGKVGSSVQMEFQGSSISVFGRVDNSSSGIVSASFSVDGSYPVSFANTAQSFVSYNKQFFQSRSLGAGVHKLTINSNSENPLWIDYILIQNGTNAPSNPTDSPSPDSGSTSTIQLVGGIAGAVGCVVLCLALTFLWRYWRRRRSNSRRPNSTATSLSRKPYKKSSSISISTSVANRPIDLEIMSPRQRFPFAGSMTTHTRVDSVPSTWSNATPSDFVVQDPFQSPLNESRTHRSHFSESSITSGTRSSTARTNTVQTAETRSFIQPVSTAPSFTTSSSSTRTRTVINPSEEDGYTAANYKKKGESMIVMTQNGTYTSSSGSGVHNDSGIRLDMEELLRQAQYEPDYEPPPEYSRD